MKPSNLFITSLLAAAAMSAAPAWATDYTYSASSFTESSKGAGTNVAFSAMTGSDTLTFTASSSGYFPGYSNGSFDANLVINSGATVTINNGTSTYGKTQTFGGSLSGGGNFTLGSVNQTKATTYIFTGDVTGFTGNIDASVQLPGTSNNTGGGIRFGKANAEKYNATAVDGVISNISGRGTITAGNTLTYNYLAGGDAYTTLKVTNSSISARTLTFGGGATYVVASALTGQNSTASNNTLTISAGTTTFTGSIANFGTITVASGATANFSNTTFKFGTLTANSVTTISNSGMVTFGEGTIFDVDSAASLVRGAQLLGGMSGQTQTFSIANLSVGGYLVNQRGSAAFSVSESGVLTLDSYTASDTNYSLTWNGGDSGVWKVGGTGWTTTDTTGEVTFQNGDSVTFGTGTENNATIAENLKVGTMTVSAATSLTGTGTIRVDAANLTTTAALTLGENVVLNLGSSASATNKNILGAGTVKFVSTAAGHGGTLTLGNGFTGTIEYSGKFNTSNGTNNANAKFALSNGSMWGGSGTNTLTNDIHFLTNYQLGDTTATTIVLNGNLTQADGTTLTIGTNANTNITFGGAGTVISDLRISAGTLTMNAGQATIKGSQLLVGNLTINSGATVYVAQNDSLSYGSSNTVTVNQGGVLSFGNYRWTVGANNKIVINGGEISGAGEGSNGALDFYQANTAAVTASAGSASTISAAIRLRGVTATFTTNDGATLTLSGPINGAGTLVKAETGELVVSGTNVYTGGTIVNGGVLTVKNASALGTLAAGKSVSVANGAKLQISTSNVNLGNAGGGVVLERGAKLVIDYANLTPTAESTATEKTFEIMTAAVFSIYGSTLSAGDVTNDMTAAWELLGGDSAWLESAKWTLANNTLSLTLTIPEPSMFGLMAGLGALALAGTRRRRRKA